MPLTVSPSPGDRPGVFGIWYWLREVPKMPVIRAVGSMMPGEVGKAASLVGLVMDRVKLLVGFSMPIVLCRYSPVMK